MSDQRITHGHNHTFSGGSLQPQRGMTYPVRDRYRRGKSNSDDGKMTVDQPELQPSRESVKRAERDPVDLERLADSLLC